MAIFYQEGTHRVRIVHQGFPDPGEYGQQFIITIQPIGNAQSYDRPVYLSLTNADGQPSDYSDKSIEVLKYLGFHGNKASLARLDPSHPQFHDFAGIECEAYCKHKEKEKNGVVKVFEQWYINTPRSGGISYVTPEPTALKKLDSLFGKELKSPPPTTVQDSPPPTAPPVDISNPEAVAAATAGQKDIPF